MVKAAPAQRTTYEPAAKAEPRVCAVTNPASLAKYKVQVGFVVRDMFGFFVNEIIGSEPAVVP